MICDPIVNRGVDFSCIYDKSVDTVYNKLAYSLECVHGESFNSMEDAIDYLNSGAFYKEGNVSYTKLPIK
jgi:hypothetical protein